MKISVNDFIHAIPRFIFAYILNNMHKESPCIAQNVTDNRIERKQDIISQFTRLAASAATILTLAPDC